MLNDRHLPFLCFLTTGLDIKHELATTVKIWL
jgi:hypothetical protein